MAVSGVRSSWDTFDTNSVRTPFEPFWPPEWARQSNLVETENRQYRSGRIDLTTAKAEARKALKRVNVGETGYIYAMTTKGDLTVHVAQEGENIYNEKDENGRFFIREMCETAVKSGKGQVLSIIYPWRNAVLGDKYPRKKVVAYLYFKEWDWIIAAGGYLEETYEDDAFERSSFAELKEKIKSKKVGKTGYIYCMDSKGTLTVHPNAAGQNLFDATDHDGTDPERIGHQTRCARG